MPLEVGFIGLGSMGAAIARRLMLADVQLHVFDVAAAAVTPFAAKGTIVHDSPRAVADEVDVLFVCLPTVETSLRVAGEVTRGCRVRIYVECSTIGRAAMQTLGDVLAGASISLVDAPVSGGPKAADAGHLAVIASGPAAALEQVRPLLRHIGSSLFEVGQAPGQAQMMKLVNNFVSAANMVGAFEATVLGAKAGLDPETMVKVLNAGTGRNTATETKLPQAVLTGSFDFGASINVITKDVELALDEAAALGVPMWSGQAIAHLWRFAVSQGGGDADYTTLIRFMERWAGAEVRARKPSVMAET